MGLRILLSTMDILTETQNFWQRFQRGGAFRVYLRHRLHLVIPALVIFLAYSVATTAGTVITFGGTRSVLVLLGLLSAPVILIVSLFFQAFVFLLWLENRAIAHATHKVPRTAKWNLKATPTTLRAVFRTLPPLALAVGAAFLLVPFLFLAALSFWVALLMLALVLATPFAYAVLDR
jgi:type IV secretory pathway TrbD component